MSQPRPAPPHHRSRRGTGSDAGQHAGDGEGNRQHRRAFDPAGSYETANNEACGNIYRKLIIPDPADANRLIGDLAESWQINKDGLAFTFQIQRGVKFDSGNELTAEDAAFSFHRVIKLNKTPGFIFTQFGWNADNVEKTIRATATIRWS